MYNEILQTIISLMQTIGVRAVVGSMPPDNGLAVSAQGGVDNVHFDVGGTGAINVTINGKNTDQEVIIESLNAVHALLTRRKDFPSGGVWQVTSIRTVSSPRLIGREANSQWLYGSSVAVNFYQKGI